MARSIKVPNFRLKVPRLPKVDEPYEDAFEEMTLQAHLEELRDRIIKLCFAIGLAFVAGWFLSDPVLNFMLEQANVEAGAGFQTLNPADPLTSSMKVALYIAISLALPVILYQLIAFLSPGLTRKEKRFLLLSLPFVVLLFLGGIAFALFVAIPSALAFLSNFRSEIFEYTPTAESTLSFYLTLTSGLGIAFQLPLIMYILARLNIVSPKRMSQYRRYAAMAIMVVAAIITPTIDPFNMVIVAAPIYILYEVGIVLGRAAAR